MMTNRLNEASEREKETASQIKAAVENEIARRQLTTRALAEKLEMLPVGVEMLKERRWSLETAWRIAEALNVHVELNVSRG